MLFSSILSVLNYPGEMAVVRLRCDARRYFKCARFLWTCPLRDLHPHPAADASGRLPLHVWQLAGSVPRRDAGACVASRSGRGRRHALAAGQAACVGAPPARAATGRLEALRRQRLTRVIPRALGYDGAAKARRRRGQDGKWRTSAGGAGHAGTVGVSSIRPHLKHLPSGLSRQQPTTLSSCLWHRGRDTWAYRCGTTPAFRFEIEPRAFSLGESRVTSLFSSFQSGVERSRLPRICNTAFRRRDDSLECGLPPLALFPVPGAII